MYSSFEAFVNSKDGDEMTALHLALERGMYTRVELLLEEYQAGTCVHVFVWVPCMIFGGIMYV